MLLKRSLEQDRAYSTALTFLVGSRETTWGKLCPTVKREAKDRLWNLRFLLLQMTFKFFSL